MNQTTPTLHELAHQVLNARACLENAISALQQRINEVRRPLHMPQVRAIIGLNRPHDGVAGSVSSLLGHVDQVAEIQELSDLTLQRLGVPIRFPDVRQ